MRTLFGTKPAPLCLSGFEKIVGCHEFVDRQLSRFTYIEIAFYLLLCGKET